MPFFPMYAISATWRPSLDGKPLLVVTVTDEEDGRQTTSMAPTSTDWSAMVFELGELLHRYDEEHRL